MWRLPKVKGVVALISIGVVGGCFHHHAHITAVPLSPNNQCEPEGIPYYLPKPLLVVAKNVRHIDEAKVGLTNSAPIPHAFDDQASYASIKANVTVPGDGSLAAAGNTGTTSLPGVFDDSKAYELPATQEHMTPGAERIQDGLTPDSFYTYQIVFIPDLTQKYGLRVKGGPGEIRAAMNLVNGWMYTGMGPYYMKNSSTAQNIMAAGVGSLFAGRAAADVINEVGELARVVGEVPGGAGERAIAADELSDKYVALARALQSETVVPQTMLNYAEIHIYEPELCPDGTTTWRLVAEHHFDRQYFQPSMDEKGVELFKSILGVERGEQERAQAERAEAEKSQQRHELEMMRARGEGQAERALPLGFPSSGGTVLMPFFLDQNRVAPPPTNNSSDTLEDSRENPSNEAPLPEPSSSSHSDMFTDAGRLALGLGPVVTPPSTAPGTEVNVNVNPAFRPHLATPQKILHHRDSPKISTKVKQFFDIEERAQPGTKAAAGPGESAFNF